MSMFLICSCDSETAKELEGYWQNEEDPSNVWMFDKQGELGGICGDNNLWIVKFGKLYIKTTDSVFIYRIKANNDKISVYYDSKWNDFCQVSKEEAFVGKEFAQRLVGLATDKYTYSNTTKNTTKSQLDYPYNVLKKIKGNTYVANFDEVDCGDNIYLYSHVIELYNNKITIFAQRFRIKNGTSPQRVAAQIKSMLENKFGFSMVSDNNVSEDIGGYLPDKPAYVYVPNRDEGNSYAIIYDNNTLDFVVGFDVDEFVAYIGIGIYADHRLFHDQTK